MYFGRMMTLAAFLLVVTVGPGPDGDDKKSKAMKSKNYRIEWSTTSLGVATMKSKSYQLKGTLGQIAVGESSSSNYRLEIGFWPMVARKLERIKPRPPA